RMSGCCSSRSVRAAKRSSTSASGIFRSPEFSTRRSTSTCDAEEADPVTLTLYVDAERWRSQHKRVIDSYPGIVPVAKGNGYGFGVERLAQEAAGFGADILAVGTYDEMQVAAKVFEGDLLVLTPFRPFV